jgi:hypothetical protein
VDYILINELFSRDFATYNAYVHRKSLRSCLEALERDPGRFAPLPAPEGLRLFRVLPAGGSQAAAGGDSARPAAGSPEGRPMGEGLLLLEGRYGAESARPGEGAWVVTRWTLSGCDAGALPAKVYVRAQPIADPGPERFSLRRDPVRKPWNVFPLGGEAYPYLLWREGEVAADSHFVRVPPGCPAGTYALEIAVEEAPFFPVRMLRGLERGAMRTGWTPIDTLEVTP